MKRGMLRRDTSTMLIYSLSNDDSEIVLTLRSLAQAGIIFIMALAIIITNVLIIATLVNFKGKFYFNFAFFSVPIYFTFIKLAISF